MAMLVALLVLGACKKEEDCSPNTPSLGGTGEPPQIGFWSLAQQDSIVDAEYDRAHDRMVVVTANADRLVIIDPITRTETPVDLNLDPNCVSVDPAGDLAVVGHNGWISLVDLNTATVSHVYPMTCNVWDVVVANGWCHAFPTNDQWVNVHSMDLATGAETLNGSLYEQAHAKLRPGTLQLYAISGVVTPSDLIKFEAASGPATYLYDSPYHGDHNMGGNLWMSDDGARIFTEGRSVFHATDLQASDILYAGTVAGPGHIRHLDQSTLAGQVCSINAWNDWELPFQGLHQVDTAITFYSGDFLDPTGSTILPTALLSGQAERFHGLFCYFNASGTACHVVMKARSAAGVPHWAMTTINL